MTPFVPEPDLRRERLWRIIFLSDTPAGRRFDLSLLWLIGLSVLTLTLESMDELRVRWGAVFWSLEWVITGLFTLEYAARLWVVKKKWSYAGSFFGVVDLVSVLPSYIELMIPGTHYLMAMRVLRVLRMFRILKMVEYLGEASILINALKGSRKKIMVFLTAVMSLVFVEGTVMYVLESGTNRDFSNIPQSVYWAIVTITTVGYGDMAPVTVLGKMMASVIMLTGFAIIAVPTGIVTHEIGLEMSGRRLKRKPCKECGWEDHDPRALCCQHCGVPLG